MEEELTIDLRQYLNVLFRRRRLIASITLLSLIVAGVASVVFPPPYEAVAGVAIVKFPIPYETVAGVEAVRASAQLQNLQPQVKPESHRQSLKGLVPNVAIAQAVISRLGERLRPEDRDPSRLLEKVQGDILKSGTEQGDLVLVKVRDQDPAYAAELANAWAAEYERYVNGIYGGGSGGAPGTAQSELEQAWKNYESAQKELEAYLADNPLDELQQRMDQLQKIVGTLHQQRLDVLATAIQKRLATQAVLMEQYLGAYNTAMTTPLNKELEARINLLAQLYAARVENQRILEEAQALRAQVARGGDPSARSNSLALVLLKAQAFSSSSNLPGSLQLVLGGVGDLGQGAFGQVLDLDALIAVLEEQGKRLEEEIARETQALQSGQWAQSPALDGKNHPLQRLAAQAWTDLFNLKDMSDLIPAVEDTAFVRLIAQYTAEMDQIRAQIEQAEARKRELTQRRDLAWDSYTTLSRKYAEVSIATTVTGSTVRFAMPASRPISRTVSRPLIIALAGLLGLFGGVFAAFLLEWLGVGEPPPLWGPPGAIWNRAWRWALAPASGLPAGETPGLSSGGGTS